VLCSLRGNPRRPGKATALTPSLVRVVATVNEIVTGARGS